jgi:hypothetical protein
MSSRQLTDGAKPRISRSEARDSWYDSLAHFVPLHFCSRYDVFPSGMPSFASSGTTSWRCVSRVA